MLYIQASTVSKKIIFFLKTFQKQSFDLYSDIWIKWVHRHRTRGIANIAFLHKMMLHTIASFIIQRFDKIRFKNCTYTNVYVLD